ncbi:MAG: MBL fold metallo-hydrolase, partial [Planctomycetes bacterium]|nr:MBL fold metallo-hydrolase [Planctomycetota bacterium]
MTRMAFYLPAGMALVGSMVAAVAGSDVPSVSQVTITYLANEGIMVTSGDKAVLVDALFRGGVSSYELHEPAELEKIETAKPPYDRVDLVLVTHFHADHFDAASVVRHLENNKNAVLVTSEQVAKEVQKAAADIAGIASRIRARTPDVK